jgi:hypothetical protein
MSEGLRLAVRFLVETFTLALILGGVCLIVLWCAAIVVSFFLLPFYAIGEML